MKNQKLKKQSGFTIVELLTVVAVIAILGAVAVIGYQQYTNRARGAEIIEKYDAIRTSVAIRSKVEAATDSCAELAKGFDQTNLNTSSATLAYGFEATTGGYRPVLTVCAQAGNNPLGVATARGTYDTLIKQGVVEKNPVITDSVVSFALRLTDGDAALCKTAPPAATATACAPATAQSAQPAQPTQPAQSVQAAQTPTAPTAASVMAALPPAEKQEAQQALDLMKNDPAAAAAINKFFSTPVPGAKLAIFATPQLAAMKQNCPGSSIGPADPVDSPNGDSYGGSCQTDFPGVCDVCYVQEVCQTTCGVYGEPTPAQRKLLEETYYEGVVKNCLMFPQNNWCQEKARLDALRAANP
jgi:prepilin-type N-terminal cleavage/methylation domain-containing protein